MELTSKPASKRANPATIRHTHGESVAASGMSQIVEAKPFKAYVWGGTDLQGVSQRESQVTSGRTGKPSQIVDGRTD